MPSRGLTQVTHFEPQPSFPHKNIPRLSVTGSYVSRPSPLILSTPPSKSLSLSHTCFDPHCGCLGYIFVLSALGVLLRDCC
ncbi:unnamed protein product [Hymenolepis diminuta]|uniref:Uncharacterized protein n=1 Tax=Hymenolepis diminuta TaxID=6216 RepID=A0A564Y3C7_HYMDI|nr:unnamed protein product [Hymenolepis diminuta]